jgi:hypothetical protein
MFFLNIKFMNSKLKINKIDSNYYWIKNIEFK